MICLTSVATCRLSCEGCKPCDQMLLQLEHALPCVAWFLSCFADCYCSGHCGGMEPKGYGKETSTCRKRNYSLSLVLLQWYFLARMGRTWAVLLYWTLLWTAKHGHWACPYCSCMSFHLLCCCKICWYRQLRLALVVSSHRVRSTLAHTASISPLAPAETFHIWGSVHICSLVYRAWPPICSSRSSAHQSFTDGTIDCPHYYWVAFSQHLSM